MAIPPVRIRKEPFGYTLAFASGTIGFYQPSAGPLLLRGTTEQELEAHRLTALAVGDNFHLTGPLVAWIEVTRACNLPCQHCYINAGKARQDELSTAEMKQLLDELKAHGVFCVVFLGGEPFLRPDFLELVHYAHAQGFVISIGSNGSYITQDVIAQLPRQETFVSISLDGVAFQRQMRVLSTYDEVRERLLLLKHNDIPTGVMCVLTEHNVEEVDQILDFAMAQRFYFGVTPFSPIGRGKTSPGLQPTAAIAARAAAIAQKASVHETAMMAQTGLCFTKFFDQCYTLSQAIRREFCGISLVYVQSDGQVFPCTTCASAKRFRAGHLRHESFAAIWAQGFRDIRRITWEDFQGCSTCELAREPYICTSRCPVMSEVYTGDPLQCGSTPFLQESLRLRTSAELAREGREDRRHEVG